ncbi:MAG TPA: hypothetical protein VKR42_06440 [Ktedonobacteraceae bacterium]|nr:hypothetical protein [Ktedonobacteraceae bacterium]
MEPGQTPLVVPQPSLYGIDNPDTIPPPPPPPPTPRRTMKPGLIIGLILAVIILIGGGSVAGIVIASKFTAHNTPTANSTTPSQASSSNTSTPVLTTVPSSTSITSDGTTPITPTSTTSSTIAALDASTSNPYPPMRGTLALNDSFAQPLGTWDNSSNCQFTNKEYIVKTAKGFTRCMDNNRSESFKNFTYQVRMQFLTQNSCGGIIFRNQVDSYVADYYEFYICTDGNYYCGVVGGLYNSLANGAAIFNTGVQQPNILAVVAQDSQFQLYVNGVLVNQVNETHFSNGTIAVFAYYLTDPNAVNEVAFNDVKVWTL